MLFFKETFNLKKPQNYLTLTKNSSVNFINGTIRIKINKDPAYDSETDNKCIKKMDKHMSYLNSACVKLIRQQNKL